MFLARFLFPASLALRALRRIPIYIAQNETCHKYTNYYFLPSDQSNRGSVVFRFRLRGHVAVCDFDFDFQGDFLEEASSTFLLCMCARVCVFIKLHITAQSGPVILVIRCHTHWSSQDEINGILVTKISGQTRQRGHTLSTVIVSFVCVCVRWRKSNRRGNFPPYFLVSLLQRPPLSHPAVAVLLYCRIGVFPAGRRTVAQIDGSIEFGMTKNDPRRSSGFCMTKNAPHKKGDRRTTQHHREKCKTYQNISKRATKL